ncbi:hypothetical protein CgunFtcFv8_018828 [Champsocephalus gunnari]|uniref:Uncharacterized protein n=1 Tax=Champsocephalus gunnari TaxID=52237 RepID=A0AAN8BU87_CHAGU|nr:hypothetical protein CgunFtcFv8_018828 [Champsocephalus gunnari]
MLQAGRLLKRATSSCAVDQFQCVLRPSTRGSTRPQGSLWRHSHLDPPHTPAPHRTQTPFHMHTRHGSEFQI